MSILSPADRNVLIFSQRNLNDNVSRCSGFEFEDVIDEIEDCQIVAPRLSNSRKLPLNPKRWLSRRSNLFQYWPSGVQKSSLPRNYDLFFCNAQKPLELLALDAIPNWRDRCGLAVCVLEEVWSIGIEQYLPLIRSLSKFDLITSAFAESCEALQRITGKPVIHLPGAADMVRFAPQSLTTDRPIDIYCMGRRRPELHDRLLITLAERQGFYLYDSATKPPITAQHKVHRDLLANLIQHSKLFMVDIAKIGHDDQIKGNIAWGPRHVEGIAGGAVQVGYAPETEDYLRYFDWPESVIRLPQDPDKAIDRIASILDDPAEQERMRLINLSNALHKHDWLNRWSDILQHLSLPETEAMVSRRQTLSRIAEELAGQHPPYLGSTETA
jgi:hypothetical protein